MQANLDKVVFEQLHTEDVDHHCESALCSMSESRSLVEIQTQFRLTHTHDYDLASSSLPPCRISYPRGVVKMPSSSNGIKLVKNSSVKNSNSSTRLRKLVL